MKIPFYDLTFLNHHRRSNGSVLSRRSVGIGNFPKPTAQSHLRALRNASNGQQNPAGYGLRAVDDVNDTRSMTPSMQN